MHGQGGKMRALTVRLGPHFALRLRAAMVAAAAGLASSSSSMSCTRNTHVAV